MADYCTYSHVAVLVGETGDFSADTNPTSTQITTIIGQITKEIDTILGSIGITAQPTNSNVLGMFQKYCSFGSAGIACMTYGKNFENVDSSVGDWYYKKYEEWLKWLVENPDILGLTTDGISMSSNVLDGTYTESEIKDMQMTNEEYKF